jgi:hypothetical protein
MTRSTFSRTSVGVALRDLAAVAVIDADQLNAFRARRALQAGGDLFRELVVGPLCGVPEPVEFLLERPQRRAVEILANLLDHATAFQGVEQTERHALRQPAPCGDLPQGKGLARRSKGRQQA